MHNPGRRCYIALKTLWLWYVATRVSTSDNGGQRYPRGLPGAIERCHFSVERRDF